MLRPGPGFGDPGHPPDPPPVARSGPQTFPERARGAGPGRRTPGHVTSRDLGARRQLGVSCYSPRGRLPGPERGTRKRRRRSSEGSDRLGRTKPGRHLAARCLCPLTSLPGAGRAGSAGSAPRPVAPPRGLRAKRTSVSQTEKGRGVTPPGPGALGGCKAKAGL